MGGFNGVWNDCEIRVCENIGLFGGVFLLLSFLILSAFTKFSAQKMYGVKWEVENGPDRRENEHHLYFVFFFFLFFI